MIHASDPRLFQSRFWKRTRFARLLLPCLFAGSLSAAKDAWVEVRSPHFVVESDAGERKAKDVARKFEEIRAVFQAVFPGVIVDPAQPMLIMALKDDDSLKAFLLDYAAAKDRAKLAGWFQSTLDTNYALLNVSSDENSGNAYRTIFHEYTHAVVRMNFGPIPTWLNEGLADYYGNTLIKDGETDIGRVAPWQVRLLRDDPPIPLADLLQVDERSPLYSERNRASMFYAESWALVHYLVSSPECAQQHLFQSYLAAIDQGLDSMAAAKQVFGDLGEFEKRLRAYTRRMAFQYSVLKPVASLKDSDFPSRPTSLAEQLSIQADLFARTGHVKEAAGLAQQAVKMAPDLGAAHEAAGLVSRLQSDDADAVKEFTKADQLGGRDFRPSFYLAELGQRGPDPDWAKITAHLERTIALNPGFAPAYALLAGAYMNQPATREKAPETLVRAIKLDPANLNYLADLGRVYLALGSEAGAEAISERLTKSARTPQEKQMAAALASSLSPQAK